MDNLSLCYHTIRVAKAIEILKRRWVKYPLPLPTTINGDGFESIPNLDVYEDLWRRAGLVNPLDVNWVDVTNIDKEYLETVMNVLDDQLTLCKYDTAITLHPVHTAFCVFVECFSNLYENLIKENPRV